jgi:signal transduction histidine kinase
LAIDAGQLTIEVSDNGLGVPEADQAHVFEKFRQGGDTRQRSGGTGLGLPISRRIVEHFGGRLWLRSRPGEGATFGIELPLAEPARAQQGTHPGTQPGDDRDPADPRQETTP